MQKSRGWPTQPQGTTTVYVLAASVKEEKYARKQTKPGPTKSGVVDLIKKRKKRPDKDWTVVIVHRQTGGGEKRQRNEQGGRGPLACQEKGEDKCGGIEPSATASQTETGHDGIFSSPKDRKEGEQGLEDRKGVRSRLLSGTTRDKRREKEGVSRW